MITAEEASELLRNSPQHAARRASEGQVNEALTLIDQQIRAFASTGAWGVTWRVDPGKHDNALEVAAAVKCSLETNGFRVSLKCEPTGEYGHFHGTQVLLNIKWGIPEIVSRPDVEAKP